MHISPKNLPSTIGVYIFKSSTGEILYIGKSVNIKARVKSHFENAKLDAKERLIVENAHKIETIATESEFKALILESSLIQKHRPKYNKIWMDDKSYLYVRITMGEEYPKVSLIRKSDIGQENVLRITNYVLRRKKDLFFGPFSSRRTLENLLREIRRVIPFCTSKRLTKTPCFYSKIGLCNPCPNLIANLEQNLFSEHCDSYGFRADKNGLWNKNIRKNPPEIRINRSIQEEYIRELKREYRRNIKAIIGIFKGKVEIVLKDLRKELNGLSVEQKYEEALLMRNRIERFERLISERNFDDDIFIVGAPLAGAQGQAQGLPLQNITSILRPYFPNLEDIIRKIECYDVSNLNFREATAAMTVAVEGQVDKGQYRKFKILSNTNQPASPAKRGEYYPILTNTNKKLSVIPAKAGIQDFFKRNIDSDFRQNDRKGDTDWDFMHSVFLRRFKHGEWEFPNLLVVDGGKPQVRMAVECMLELQLQIPVIGIAKNPDRLVIGIENLPTIRPELNNSGFNLIRLLRDEAHRFGRKYHLFLREKRV